MECKYGRLEDFISNIEDVAVGSTNYLINMNSLDKIFEINFHRQTVRVQGGTNLYRLSPDCGESGWKLSKWEAFFSVLLLMVILKTRLSMNCVPM